MNRKNPLFVATESEQQRIDKLIAAAYCSPQRGRGAIKRLQNQLQCEHHDIYKRALAIGLITGGRKKQPEWTAAEMAILEEQAHNHPINIRKILKNRCHTARTPTAIQVQMHKMGINRTEERIAVGIYSAHGAAKLLGVSNHVVTAHISAGRIKADRDSATKDGRFKITEKSLRSFIANHIIDINLAKVDKFWLAQQIKA